MLSINEVLGILKNELNKQGDILWNITPYEQQFYGNDILDRDGNYFIAGTIFELPMPKITNFYSTRTREFRLEIKGHRSLLDDAIKVVDKIQQFDYDNAKFYLSSLIVDSIALENAGYDKTKFFFGYISITINIPTFITNNDVVIKVNDKVVNVVSGFESFDKALISSVDFGNNNLSDLNTGSEHTFSFVLDESTSDIFESLISKRYNQIFNFNIDYITHVVDIDLVLRTGNIQHIDSDNPLIFSATFQRALERKKVWLNDTELELIGFTPQMALTPQGKTINGVDIVESGTISRNFSFYIVNDKDNKVINDLLLEFKDYKGKKFVLKYTINDIVFTHKTMLSNIVVPETENPNAIIQVVLVESGD